MSDRKKLGRAIAAGAVAVTFLVFAGLHKGGGSNESGGATGGSSSVRQSDPGRINVNATSTTACNQNAPEGVNIDVKASGLSSGKYTVGLEHFETRVLVGDTHIVTVGKSGILTHAFACTGLPNGQYKVTVIAQSTNAQGDDAVDVYKDRK